MLEADMFEIHAGAGAVPNLKLVRAMLLMQQYENEECERKNFTTDIQRNYTLLEMVLAMFGYFELDDPDAEIMDQFEDAFDVIVVDHCSPELFIEVLCGETQIPPEAWGSPETIEKALF